MEIVFGKDYAMDILVLEIINFLRNFGSQISMSLGGRLRARFRSAICHRIAFVAIFIAQTCIIINPLEGQSWQVLHDDIQGLDVRFEHIRASNGDYVYVSPNKFLRISPEGAKVTYRNIAIGDSARIIRLRLYDEAIYVFQGQISSTNPPDTIFVDKYSYDMNLLRRDTAYFPGRLQDVVVESDSVYTFLSWYTHEGAALQGVGKYYPNDGRHYWRSFSPYNELNKLIKSPKGEYYAIGSQNWDNIAKFDQSLELQWRHSWEDIVPRDLIFSNDTLYYAGHFLPNRRCYIGMADTLGNRILQEEIPMHYFPFIENNGCHISAFAKADNTLGVSIYSFFTEGTTVQLCYDKQLSLQNTFTLRNGGRAVTLQENGLGGFIVTYGLLVDTSASIVNGERSLLITNLGSNCSLEGVTAATDAIDIEQMVEIFPNPAINTVFVKVSDSVRSLRVLKLLSIDGRTIQRHNYQPGSTVVELTTAERGLHIVQLQTDEQVFTRKVYFDGN